MAETFQERMNREYGSGLLKQPLAAPTARDPEDKNRFEDYDKIIDFYKRAYEEKEAEKSPYQANEKRDKAKKLMAGIGDIANAFYQAYAYSRGKKPMTSDESMSEKLSAEEKKRLDEEKAWREKHKQELMSLGLNIAKAEQSKANAVREYNRQKAEQARKNQETANRQTAEEHRHEERVAAQEETNKSHRNKEDIERAKIASRSNNKKPASNGSTPNKPTSGRYAVKPQNTTQSTQAATTKPSGSLLPNSGKGGSLLPNKK